MSTVTETRLDGAALEAWRGYLTSHAAILRALDAELVAEHGLTTRDYEVLLFLAQADGHHLAMSALAERTMLTRSGITRLVDGLVGSGLIERHACLNDARVSYAQLTDDRLRNAAQGVALTCRRRPPAVRRALLRRGAQDVGRAAQPTARCPTRGHLLGALTSR